MKLIFVFLAVCTLMQSISCNPTAATTRRDSKFFTSDFEYGLFDQYIERRVAIVTAWLECRKTFRTRNQNTLIFRSANWDGVTNTAKCLVDCTMRNTGVMTDKGFDEDQYMRHIKQLRYNYTSFDINSKPLEEKAQILHSMAKLATQLEKYEQNGSAGSRYNALIQSYADAAHNCKGLKDVNEDNCETSFMIMRCIAEKLKKDAFTAPFYPELEQDVGI
jgi:hypothetical protein